MRMTSMGRGLGAAVTATLAAKAAGAQEMFEGLKPIGKPHSGGIGFQPGVTEVAQDLQWLDGMLLVLCTVIVVFVMGLMLFVMLRYNSKVHPKPATFTHNSPVEVTWTVVPIVILVFIGAFSLPTLFKQQEIPEAEVLIKATGYQWYWGYEYPDEGLAFEGFLLGSPEAVVAAGYNADEYLLATDTAVVIPTGKVVVVQVTGADVIHAWAVPAFGVKQDGVPGRIAELWFKVDEGFEGIYFGQCSELCGKDHSYMPITVKAVTQEEYAAWLAGPAQDYAMDPIAPSVKVATAE